MKPTSFPHPKLTLAILALTLLLGLSPRLEAQSPYQQPSARVVRNQDGTRLNIRVDPHNQIVEETMEDSNKAVLWRLVKELDDALLPKKATKYDGRNKVVSKHRYTYLRGRLEEEEICDANDNPISKLVFYYDSKGRMNRVEQLNANGQVVSISRASGPGANTSSKSPSTSSSAVPPR